MRAPGHASSSLRARHPLASSRRGSLYGCRLRRELALRADKRSLPKRFFFTGMLSADLRQTEQGEFTQPLLMNRRQDRHFQRREPGLHDFRLDACRFHDQLVEGGSVERLLYRPGCLRRLACNGLFRGDPLMIFFAVPVRDGCFPCRWTPHARSCPGEDTRSPRAEFR